MKLSLCSEGDKWFQTMEHVLLSVSRAFRGLASLGQLQQLFVPFQSYDGLQLVPTFPLDLGRQDLLEGHRDVPLQTEGFLGFLKGF